MTDFSDRYAVLLSRYLAGEGEAARAGGYELAREAITHRNRILELVDAHREGMDRALARLPAERHREAVMAGGEFFAECVAAFEIAFDAYREAGERERVKAEVAQAGRRTAEEALQATELNYQRLFEGHPEAMWIFDVETLSFMDVNDAAVRRYGFSFDEFLAMKVTDIDASDRGLGAVEPIAPSGASEEAVAGAHRKKDGTLIEVEITSHPVTFGHRPAQFVLARDVTEKKRFEQQLRQSQRLESLGQLAGGVAHDFNNLLAVILNFAAFVKERLVVASSDPGGDRWLPAVKDMQRIERAAESAARLTHQLLAFARREVIQPKSLDINSVVAELDPLLRRTLGEHIQVVTRLDPDLRHVLFDPGQLEQVLMNLAVNARDAMPNGGRLTVETSNVEVDDVFASGRPGLNQGMFVQLAVTDTGTGMDRETLDRAFEPFFTTKPKGHGTGLGLATIYGVVRQAGGYVGIYSELGVGTRVTALLRATSAAPVAAELPESQQPGRGGETVLVVEDAEDLREVVARVLTRHGYKVILAANGVDALEVAQGHAGDIDLLLTDVVMPKMQGQELSRRLTEMRPAIRVLYMSGYPQPLLGPKSELKSNIVLIDKPFNETSLVSTVRNVLGGPSHG